MNKAMKVEITFPKRAGAKTPKDSIVARSTPVSVEVVRYDLVPDTMLPQEMMYSLRVNDTDILVVDGAEWQRLINAFSTGTW